MNNLTIILGGARSGKSAFAEQLAVQALLPKTYIATAQALDGEMADRISIHRARRDDWMTIEAPLDLVAALEQVPKGSVVLIDCLTLWLSNHMLADSEVDIESLLAAITASPSSVICVSNEVGMGLVPDNTLGRKFRDAQGTLNRRIAEHADLAVFVVAGLPVVLKGSL